MYYSLRKLAVYVENPADTAASNPGVSNAQRK
jgi:hypothetical protein